MFDVLSNLFLLIPFVTAIKLRRIFGAFILFVECWVSLIYHICTFSTDCLLPYRYLKSMDFFFAELFIIYLGNYLIYYGPKWSWLEWIVLFTATLIIAVLQFVLPGELVVQAVIVVSVLIVVILYWIIYYNTVGKKSLPEYDWICFGLGFSLISISVMMFSIQNIFPQLYWAAHSIWHITAAMGFHFILLCKKQESVMMNVARRIKFK